MMEDLKELYQETILDHNREPRNFKVLDKATHHAEGFNPLCGDKVHIYLDIADGKIREVSFQGSGCAISKSSASIMTTVLKDKTITEALSLYKKIHQLLTGDDLIDTESLGKLAVFAGVKEFPARVKCASLAWHTLRAAIENSQNTISTE